jgi:signal transduction histidine kinase/CheY-like chemotaxis protein
VDCEGSLNAVGHLCQAISLYFIYKALVEVGLTKPYDVLFRNQVRSLRRLEGVNRLQEELILPGPLEEKFKKTTEAAVDLLDLDFCRIWSVLPGDLCDSGCIHATTTDEEHLCRRRDRCLHLMASSGRYSHTDGDHRRIPLGLYKIGAIATGEEKKTVSNNATTDPRVHNHEWARSLGMVSFAGYKLHDARGKTTGVLAMFAKHPISEEDDAFLSHLAETTSKVIMDHHAHEELRQSQKLEGVGQLAGGVAHEFNNLLQVIDGYTCAGMEGLGPEEERYTDLDQVRKAAERATALTRQLLGFSRRRAIEPRNTDANLVVCDLVKLIRPTIGEHISLELALGDDVGTVYADAGELQQALLNLCLNARDAMPSGGTLLLKTEKAVVTEPLWDSHFDIKPGRYVVFSVSDTGCGIPRDLQQRIFEPFFTTKEVGKGTGLGLALVYGVVRQHKGAIHLYSEVGMGTTFKLYLPPGDGKAEEDHVEEASSELHGNETILVAEDDPMVRNLSVRTLERAGYTVLAASDGEEALRIFEEHRSAISLVMLDAIMPKLTGHEVHRRIKETSPGTKVVCCTGYDRETARSDCLVRENVPLIQKPFTARTLLSTVREALDAQTLCQLSVQTTS